jgi:hypothetical protein
LPAGKRYGAVKVEREIPLRNPTAMLIVMRSDGDPCAIVGESGNKGLCIARLERAKSDTAVKMTQAPDGLGHAHDSIYRNRIQSHCISP